MDSGTSAAGSPHDKIFKEDNGDVSESELREKFEDCTVSATFNNKQNKETGMIQKHVQTLHIM